MGRIGERWEGELFTSPGGALEMKEDRAAVRGMAAVFGYRAPELGVGRRVAKLQLFGVVYWRSCGRKTRRRDQVGVQGPVVIFTDVDAPSSVCRQTAPLRYEHR